MSAGIVVHDAAVAELGAPEPRAWVDAVGAELAAGRRLLTLFARPEGDAAAGAAAAGAVTVTAVLEAGPGRLEVRRTTLDAARGYHAFTAQHTAAHAFERELHEQHGVRIAGHPWPKPIRFATAGPAGDMVRYPFYTITGKEVHEVAVGPIHAGVIEPGAFRFMCLGETVHHLEIHLGYQHRGVEARLLEGDARRLAPLVETIAGDTSVAHAWAYAAAVEALTGHTAPAHVEATRGIALELERVAMHLAGLAGLATDLGFLQGATTYGRLRTTAINTSMRLCGSRFGRTAVRPGGGGVTVDAGVVTDVRRNLALLVTDLGIINDCFLSARTVQHRLKDVGRLTTAQAVDLGLVGLCARASGVVIDQRVGAGGAYATQPVAPITEPTGDCWARARVRLGELDASLRWIGATLESALGAQVERTPLGALAPSRLVLAVCEGWRGEVVHALETDAEGRLVHYKVQDPSLRNWLGLAIAMREGEISDFPICNKSFDLSYCGHDL